MPLNLAQFLEVQVHLWSAFGWFIKWWIVLFGASLVGAAVILLVIGSINEWVDFSS